MAVLHTDIAKVEQGNIDCQKEEKDKNGPVNHLNYWRQTSYSRSRSRPGHDATNDKAPNAETAPGALVQ